MKGKKGQFYLLAALIMIIVAFAAVSFSTSHPKEEQTDKFVQLYEGYEDQSVDVINSALMEQEKYKYDRLAQWRIMDFTEKYIDYSKTIKPGFNMLYMLTNNNQTEIRNYLEEDAIVNNQTLKNYDHAEIADAKTITVMVDEDTYVFEIKKRIQLDVLFRSEDEEGVRIHVSQI